MDRIAAKLRKARTMLLLDHPFFGSLCLRMEPKPDPHCATAWTDGRTLAYNPAYVAGLRRKQVQGLLAHTVMHPACQHHTRRAGRDPKLWNMASDYAINWILLDAGLDLPPKYLDNPAYHGLTADEIYADLHASRGEEMRPSLSEGQGDSDGEADWDGAAGMKGDGDDLGKSSESGPGGESDGHMDIGGEGDESGEMGGEMFGDPGGSGEVRDSAEDAEGGGSSEGASDEEWELALAEAARQARDMGELPGGVERLVGAVLHPVLDWRELLEQYISDRARDDYSWTPPNKRFLHLDVLLPSLSNRQLPDLVLAIDTSGSVSEPEMDQFAAEVSGILDAYDTTLHVAYCDSAMAGTETFCRADLPLELNPTGGGGTDYRPVFDWVRESGLNPGCLVYLTDLECTGFPAREPEYPVLWARIGGQGGTPPFGEILDIN
ncbi:DUF2201 family putative metallopeptidase [Pseudodesulfovibrio sp.]|uniref:vWA domain-containing protein n=1 Tax=unclassified Pseudodesulfovibrio TaxID=2661612 RepID=UPI003B00FE13